ncbi:uncharacterized protein LOC126905314 [Daktulosphaira vitifoliae]|uniref:uncharacterized protein LOC126905314 n=1 Tax=Daktulosphaira vitifoliae TaxID=58002 RepID=UPI0021AAB107|nr:uncharacterized protein LOC126905314 [Daktulosphaira vitifoliae]
MANKTGIGLNVEEVKNRKLLHDENLRGDRIAIYAKKFEILREEMVSSGMLSDCIPIIMDLITCELKVDKGTRKTILHNLIQMVVASNAVVKRLATLWKADVLMRDLLKVIREHVMTQYKHYQLYAHHTVSVLKGLSRLMKKNKAKENEFIKTTYILGDDKCTVLNALMVPLQYLSNMNRKFDELAHMVLEKNDKMYLDDILQYMKQVFNKIQPKLDSMSKVIDDIFVRYERRCQKRNIVDERWKKLKEKLKEIFENTIVKPCLFTMNLYMNYYFPNEDQMKDFMENIVKKNY